MPFELHIAALDAVSISASGFPCRIARSMNALSFKVGLRHLLPRQRPTWGPAQHALPALQMCQHLEQLTRTIEVGTAPMFQTATASKVRASARPPSSLATSRVHFMR